jgi:hypothetical protein
VERFHPCFSLSLFGFHSNSYSVPTSVPCVMTAFAACCPFQDLASSAYTSSPGTAFQILLVPSNALLPASRCLFLYSIQRSSFIGIYLTRVLANLNNSFRHPPSAFREILIWLPDFSSVLFSDPSPGSRRLASSNLGGVHVGIPSGAAGCMRDTRKRNSRRA